MTIIIINSNNKQNMKISQVTQSKIKLIYVYTYIFFFLLSEAGDDPFECSWSGVTIIRTSADRFHIAEICLDGASCKIIQRHASTEHFVNLGMGRLGWGRGTRLDCIKSIKETGRLHVVPKSQDESVKIKVRDINGGHLN